MRLYPSELKEKILKQYLEDDKTAPELSREHNVPAGTIYKWVYKLSSSKAAKPIMKEVQMAIKNLPKGWDAKKAMKAAIFCEGKTFNSTEVGEYCRQQGIRSDQLRSICEWVNSTDFVPKSELEETKSQLTEAKKETKKLASELKRKDSALAETAALLVLSKKASAIWGENKE